MPPGRFADDAKGGTGRCEGKRRLPCAPAEEAAPQPNGLSEIAKGQVGVKVRVWKGFKAEGPGRGHSLKGHALTNIFVFVRSCSDELAGFQTILQQRTVGRSDCHTILVSRSNSHEYRTIRRSVMQFQKNSHSSSPGTTNSLSFKYVMQ